ncbi:MAG: hypothetical protein JSU72_13165 [Deltaproteobacteria bacterium]|nr:MAG: hypothetical protein JSU72_13165 [Deltaproteobacteria bacterium]
MTNLRYSIHGTPAPMYRFELKGKIHASGYRTISEFANAINVDVGQVSRCINGWLFPGPTLQRAMARQLGLTLKQLRELL